MSRRAEESASAPILITMGEPAGIGPEIAVKTWRALDGRVDGHPLKLVGDPDVFRAQLHADALPADALWPAAERVACLDLDPANAPAVIGAIDLAVRSVLARQAAAIVTAPIHKSVLIEAGFEFAGHTEYLAKLTGAPRAVMMLTGGGLRVVPLTIHVPFADVAAMLSPSSIVQTAEIVLASLRGDFAVERPRLAIAGLNPHAGEAGRLGREEIEIIAPAADVLRGSGHHVLGPLPGDTMFHAEARAGYDAALCMYHDQALIPLKTLAFWEGVNVTLGLPIVRTSPDHGTALDIAGQNKADTRSMIAAIKLAASIADARAAA
jgi:4-hydroxythreonine-4-phosphate dehydrogenase